MTKPAVLSSRIYLTLEGSEVQKPVMQKLAEVLVDQHSHLPGFFSIRFQDPGLELLDQGPFDLTKEVEIQAATEDGTKVTLIKGEITALEPVFDEGMVSELVVSGYDRSHRLFRQAKSTAYLNKKDSDLAGEIARSAGLQAQVDTTRTVYDHIYQHNQTDLEFLQQRAWRIGYECFVDDGKLYFRKPPSSEARVSLTWGQDLTSFRPRMSLAEQVDEVLVKGWDVEKVEPIVGKATSGKLYPKVKEAKDGAGWAKTFGAGKQVIIDQPVVSQSEADTLAAARLDEVSGAFIEAEGEAFRRPDIKAGQKIRLEALGKRFSGAYLVTRACHRYTASGLKTTFSVRGARTGLLGEMLLRQPPLDRWPGAVPALVTNSEDPKGWGRVKVKFPWLADDAESDWARVVSVGAGPEAGLCAIPAVGDEVLVLFAHGDFSQPYVLGGLWNGQTRLPPETANAGSSEKPKVRSWRSLTGHQITLYDDAKNKVEILTHGGHKVSIDDARRKITIASQGGQTITLDDGNGKISLEAKSEVEIKAGGSLKIKANGNLDIEASGNVNVKGATINLN